LNVDFSNPSPDLLGSRKPAHVGVKEGYPSNRRYLSTVGLSSLKMVADSMDVLLNITSTGNELLRIVNIDDLD